MKPAGPRIWPKSNPHSSSKGVLYMNDIFHVDRSLPIPLYQQLVDSIRAAIKTGQLTDGQQLPTVQELDLSRGPSSGPTPP